MPAKTKKELIKTLFSELNIAGNANQELVIDCYVQNIVAQLKKTTPNIDPKAFYIARKEITKIVEKDMFANGAFEEILYPIYAKQFSNEDIKNLIEFYNTDLGRKIILATPAITRESMIEGNNLSNSLSPQIMQQINTALAADGIKQNQPWEKQTR